MDPSPNEPASMPFTDEDRARIQRKAELASIKDAWLAEQRRALEAARVRELELALEPFARVLADVLPSPEERTDLENHGFDPDEGIPHDLGHDAPTVGDYRRAARVLASLPTSKEDAG